MRVRNIPNPPVSQLASNAKAGFSTLDRPLSQLFWLCSSSVAAVAIAPLNLPAWAEGRSAKDLQPTHSSAEMVLQPIDPIASPAIAQADAPNPQPAQATPTAIPNQNWQFSAEPYFFAPFNVNADVTVNGRSTSLDIGLSDILDLDRAFDAGLRLRAQKDRLGLILDGFYLYGRQSGSLGRSFASGSIFQFVQQTSPGRVGQFVQQFDPQLVQQAAQIGQQVGLNTPIGVSADGTVKIRQFVLDAAVSYRVLDKSLNQTSAGTNLYPRLAIAPIAGIRTNFLRQEVEVDGIRINGRSVPGFALPPVDRNFRFSKTLVEPLIGAQIDLALSERWALGFRGDVSGFNIGARQNFTWNLMLGGQYNISPMVALGLAYRFNGFDFETGDGLRRTELNLRQNGVMLSVTFRF
jgi:hypothetical protein